jgi:hypothetical protein
VYFLILVSLLSNPVEPHPYILGKQALINGEYRKSIKYMRYAIKNEYLGHAAESFIQWDIHKACEYLNDKRCSMDALLSFVTHAEIYMAQLPNSDFAKDKVIKERIELAKVLIEAYWASIGGKSCRTPERYCFLPKKRYLALYIMLIPFCGNTSNTLLSTTGTYDFRINSTKLKNGIFEVTSQCGSKFYFKPSWGDDNE